MSESIRTAPAFVGSGEALEERQAAAARPTAREWARHAALFLLTALTTTLAGVIITLDASQLPEPALAAPVGWLDHLLFLPAYYFQAVGGVITYAAAHPSVIAQGAMFAGALLSILLAHEAGHYVACRRYGVEATLPFFIPAPPPFPAGTFGAFIKIKSPIGSRRALFDIGVAGPLAGFLVLLPVALVGVLTAHPAPPVPMGELTAFTNDPLLLRLLASALGVDLYNAAPNPFYFAAWIGLLVTSLNLLPVGQLDGGHATYALFGLRPHRLLGRAAFVAILLLAVLGWFWHNAPSGFVYALLLLVMLRVRHPQPEDEVTPLGGARKLVAALTLLVFILSFTPFPITVK